jgi:hypothetical protein
MVGACPDGYSTERHRANLTGNVPVGKPMAIDTCGRLTLRANRTDPCASDENEQLSGVIWLICLALCQSNGRGRSIPFADR